MTSRSALLAVLVLVARAQADGIPSAVPPSLIVNYSVLRPGLATAGRITAEGLAQVKGFGFKTVISLRTEKEGAPLDEAALTAQGVRYVGRPVTADSLALADIEAIGQILDDKNAAPILLYCASGNRVGGVWAILQVLKGRSKEEALAEGQRIGLKPGPITVVTERLIDEALARRGETAGGKGAGDPATRR
jgi:uncharacterized protein (TIGR01244 family)